MKPDIRYITPYLPYKLQFEACGQIHDLSAVIIVDDFNYVKGGTTGEQSFYGRFKLEEIKPLLKPLDLLLTDCPGEIRDEFSEWKWVAFIDCVGLGLFDAFENIPAVAFMKMIELNYDVFQLIPQGLALDINTVITK